MCCRDMTRMHMYNSITRIPSSIDTGRSPRQTGRSLLGRFLRPAREKQPQNSLRPHVAGHGLLKSKKSGGCGLLKTKKSWEGVGQNRLRRAQRASQRLARLGESGGGLGGGEAEAAEAAEAEAEAPPDPKTVAAGDRVTVARLGEAPVEVGSRRADQLRP